MAPGGLADWTGIAYGRRPTALVQPRERDGSIPQAVTPQKADSMTRCGQAFLLLGFWAALVLAAGACRGDLVYFQGGFSVQAPARIEKDRVLVALPDREIAFPRGFVTALVPGFDSTRQWPAKLKAAGSEFEPRFTAVWWALENGLALEVEPELRRLAALDPNHEPTARMVRVLDRLKRPLEDPPLVRFQHALGVEMQSARGPHVILFHQHSAAEAEERIAVLERVLATYYLIMAASGIELRTPAARLPSAWFAERSDYLAFLNRQEAAGFGTTRGYYHPTWRAVVAFDARSMREDKGYRFALARRREELDRLREQVAHAPARSRMRIQLGGEPARAITREEAPRLIETLTAEADLRELLLECDRRAIDLGTAAHEMIHQLVLASGLVRSQDVFPRWLHEGFAAQFEVVRGGRWAGVSRAHDLRLPDWRRLSSPPALEPLIRDGGFAHGYNRDRYAEAWALVDFLRTQKPTEFLSFLDLLRASAGESASGPDRVVQSFHKAFGSDLDSLARDWIAFTNAAKTPLEQHEPPGPTARNPGRTGKTTIRTRTPTERQ